MSGFHCAACDVEWEGDVPCWMCEQPGEAGLVGKWTARMYAVGTRDPLAPENI